MCTTSSKNCGKTLRNKANSFLCYYLHAFMLVAVSFKHILSPDCILVVCRAVVTLAFDE